MSTALLGQFDDHTDVELDIETLVGSHLCISANSGAGKSGAIRKLLETTHGSLQHIVIDVEDEFYTLREKYDYLIAGGDNGDCLNEIGTQVPLRLREIIALWNAKLRQPGGQMLTHLAKTPTQWMTTDELAAALNMKAGNGYWYKGVKVAREAHLIDQEKGQFRLSEYLRSAPR
jgi:hypothetical protein